MFLRQKFDLSLPSLCTSKIHKVNFISHIEFLEFKLWWFWSVFKYFVPVEVKQPCQKRFKECSSWEDQYFLVSSSRASLQKKVWFGYTGYEALGSLPFASEHTSSMPFSWSGWSTYYRWAVARRTRWARLAALPGGRGHSTHWERQPKPRREPSKPSWFWSLSCTVCHCTVAHAVPVALQHASVHCPDHDAACTHYDHAVPGPAPPRSCGSGGVTLAWAAPPAVTLNWIQVRWRRPAGPPGPGPGPHGADRASDRDSLRLEPRTVAARLGLHRPSDAPIGGACTVMSCSLAHWSVWVGIHLISSVNEIFVHI